MGLDMYLFKVKREEVGYWRKANQVFGWIERNVDVVENCKDVYLSKTDVKALLADCEEVLADHSLAAELMPCEPGFFFGSCEYNDWYFEQLKDTVDICKNVLETFDFENYELAFHAWW